MLYNIRLLNILWWFNFNWAPPERSPKRIRACLVASHNWKPFEQCMNQEKKGERLDKIFTRRWGRMAAAILFICRLPTVLFSPFFSWFRCLHIVGGISMEYALIALTNYDECGIVYCSGRNKQRKRMKGVWKNWPPAFCFFTHFMRCGLLSYNWGGGEVWINSPFFTYLWLNNYLPQWHIHVWQQLNSLHYFDPERDAQ